MVIRLETATYHATLFSPLFYSSSEGVIISADRILSSTAITYSLAYNLGLIKKHYFLEGDKAVNHRYRELADIGLFATDGRPLEVNFKEETLRSTEYLSERSITVTVSGSPDKGEMGRFTRTEPRLMGSDSSPVIHKLRRYIGLAPESTFEFTVWSNGPLPDDLLVTLGIRRSGELRLRKTKTASKAHLNIFMLKEVYGISDSHIVDIIRASGKITRGSDYRKHHILDIDMGFITDNVVPLIFR
jgi:CRISPR-associated protein Csc1